MRVVHQLAEGFRRVGQPVGKLVCFRHAVRGGTAATDQQRRGRGGTGGGDGGSRRRDGRFLRMAPVLGRGPEQPHACQQQQAQQYPNPRARFHKINSNRQGTKDARNFICPDDAFLFFFQNRNFKLHGRDSAQRCPDAAARHPYHQKISIHLHFVSTTTNSSAPPALQNLFPGVSAVETVK